MLQEDLKSIRPGPGERRTEEFKNAQWQSRVVREERTACTSITQPERQHATSKRFTRNLLERIDIKARIIELLVERFCWRIPR
jgi:hypothetical protein